MLSKPAMFKALCPILAVALPYTCFAMDIRRIETCSGVVLQLLGYLQEGDYSRLSSRFKTNDMILGLDLSSDGGVLEEGLRIADLTHRKKLTVYVAGECVSVCAFVFFAAAKRYLGKDSRIGVHSISNSRDFEDTNSMLLTLKLASISAEFGAPNSAIGKMITTRPSTISYLDKRDLSALDATAANPFGGRKELPSTEQRKHENCEK
jgi:hypothetical protein